MKKLFLIALALVTIQVNAQDEKPEFRKGDRMQRAERFKDFTPEEIADLQTKRLALDLDLTEKQQKQIRELQLENAKEREALRESRQAQKQKTKEERLAIMNERLDKQMEMKKKMKGILNAEQFEKWEKLQTERQKFRRNSRQNRMR